MFDLFWKVIEESTTLNSPFVSVRMHGPLHWRAVAKRGQFLASKTHGADWEIVELFALFHDSMRKNDGGDFAHGDRAVMLARELGVPEILEGERWATFEAACRLHSSRITSANPTVAVCWDADRLDLPRCGITIDPDLLSTATAKMMIEEVSV